MEEAKEKIKQENNHEQHWTSAGKWPVERGDDQWNADAET